MDKAVHNFRLDIAYDGSRYRGWQKQGNTENTIQQKLESLLSRLLEQNIELAGSGRTDAGVHAREQVCSFRASTELSPEELLEDIRRYLPEDISALSLEYAPPRFHARLSCREKTYVYRIWNSPAPDVFLRRYTLHHPGTLDVEAMEKAAEYLLGSHDFTAYCSNKHMKKSAVREIYEISFSRQGGELRIAYRGNGFLYNMVRIITGSLLEVGEGIRCPEQLREALESGNRELAGPTAPAQGLFLWSLAY